jgi:malate dehydrogenase (oxaloacetate-decarboxylating)
MGAIAEGEGLIGDVVTISIGHDSSLREITVEVRDSEQAELIAGLIDALEGVRVVWHQDRALIRHEGGKLEIDPVHAVRSVQEMRDVYTPGVARVCLAISARPELASRYTMIARSVAICTNGSRVLGLGNIGPIASMPVMEGKAVFYRQFAGISAMPILIDTTNVDEFVTTVVRIAPTFGGIHLEDISAPECFEIERRLIEALPQPVMHDDVHGTAVVSVAATIAACRQAGVELRAATVGQLGLGAAGFGIASLMVDEGVRRVIAFDPLEAARERAQAKGIELGSMETVMREADVVVATTGRRGLIEPSMVHPGQVILALTNPDPEIEPADAEQAGAAFAADGRSVNNVLGYPGIFRGALTAGAKEINVEMKLAAARAIADLAGPGELVPDVLDRHVHDVVADAVREAAKRSGAARPEMSAVGL